MKIDLENEDFDKMFKKVNNFELLTINEIKSICDKSKEIFIKEPTILEINPPITLIGDIHGQFQDLMEIFYQQGYPKDGISFKFSRSITSFINIKNTISKTSFYDKRKS